jgi:peptidoglycan/LPS O-acetylase OafA/YrhL
LGIFRALGWYALAPLLVYALVSVWRLEPSVKKRWLVVMVLVITAWVLVASARAGGDQWDNPRYRTIFLPWMAAVAAWGITHARQTRDRWLCRALLIEGIFLLFFTYWYIGRYYLGVLRLELFAIIGMVVGLSIGVIVWGWLRDRRRTREDAPDPQDGPPVGDQHDYS